MMAAGFSDVSVVEVSNDYLVDEAALGEPERLFQFSPLWPLLGGDQRGAILASVRANLAARGGVLPVPSPALIAAARRA